MTTQAATAKSIILAYASQNRLTISDTQAGEMASATVDAITQANTNRADPAVAAGAAVKTYSDAHSLGFSDDQANALGSQIAAAPNTPAGR